MRSKRISPQVPSLEEVLGYFADALGEKPTEDAAHQFCFERRDVSNWGVSWRRGRIAAIEGGVSLVWEANDDFGLSELREFFEAPFFLPVETEWLYRGLEDAGWHTSLFRDRHIRMGVWERRGIITVDLRWW